MISTTEISNKSPRLRFARSGIFFGSTQNPVRSSGLHCHGCCPLRKGEAPAEPNCCLAVESHGSAGASPSKGLPARQEPRPPKGLPARREPRPPKGLPARQEPRPPKGLPARQEPRPPRVYRLGRSLALPGGYRLGRSLALPGGYRLGRSLALPRVYRLGGSLALRGVTGSAGASPSQGLPARREPRPPNGGITEHQFGDPLQDNTRWLPPTVRLLVPLQVVSLVVKTRLRTGHCILR